MLSFTHYFKQFKYTADNETARWVKDLINTKIGMFRYEGLPDNLLSDDVENMLLFTDCLCWYKSEMFGLVLCRYVPSNTYDIYLRPLTVNLISFNGSPIANNVPFHDIVLFKDNRLDMIPYVTMSSYIEKIIEMEKTLGINVKLARLPCVFSGDPQQANTFKRLLKSVADFDFMVGGSKSLTNNLEQFNISLNVDLMTLYELMDKYKKLAMASVGIYSVDEKRERIVSAEIQSANDYVDFVYQNMYECRKLAIEEVNKKFGTNIKLIEAYVENKKQDTQLMADQAHKIAVAENVGESNNGKPFNKK